MIVVSSAIAAVFAWTVWVSVARRSASVFSSAMSCAMLPVIIFSSLRIWLPVVAIWISQEIGFCMLLLQPLAHRADATEHNALYVGHGQFQPSRGFLAFEPVGELHGDDGQSPVIDHTERFLEIDSALRMRGAQVLHRKCLE